MQGVTVDENAPRALGRWVLVMDGILGHLSVSNVVFTVIILALAVNAIYRLYFHPLARLPGPRIAAISEWWYCAALLSGKSHLKFKELHDKYGPVVRFGPNCLSFTDPAAFTEIHHPLLGRKTFPKSPLYGDIVSEAEIHGVGSQRNVYVHARQRALLAPVFASRSLTGLDDFVKEHFGKFCRETERNGALEAHGVNVKEWFGLLAFDTAGCLVFGKPFGALEGGLGNPWVDTVPSNLKLAMYIDVLRRLGLLWWPMYNIFTPKQLLVDSTSHRESTTAYVKSIMTGKPLEMELKSSSHEPIFNLLLQQFRDGQMGEVELISHAEELILGTDSLKLTLSICVYCILSNPESHHKLRQIFRSRYKDASEITSSDLAQIDFFTACIRESFRIFPPGPGGLPRLSPGEFVCGLWVPEGTMTIVSPWPMVLDPQNFSDPGKFKPERWIGSSDADIREASRPFLLGPRRCLGENFAWIALRLVLAHLMYTYDMELVNKTQDWRAECEAYIVHWVAAPLWVRFSKREQE